MNRIAAVAVWFGFDSRNRVILLAFLAVCAVLTWTGLVSVDWLPALHTFGLSFGTDSHYCFADLVRGHLSAGCESAS